MNSTMTTEAGTVERLQADHGITKRLGRWTSASRFDVRVRSGVLVLDLRTPEIEGDVEVCLDLHRSAVKLLLAEGDQVDHWDLRWTGRGQVKDDQRPAGPNGRRIHLFGGRVRLQRCQCLGQPARAPASGPEERRLPDRGRPDASAPVRPDDRPAAGRGPAVRP